jgi:hypothetical protein
MSSVKNTISALLGVVMLQRIRQLILNHQRKALYCRHSMFWDPNELYWQCSNKRCQLIQYPMLSPVEYEDVPGDYWI